MEQDHLQRFVPTMSDSFAASMEQPSRPGYFGLTLGDAARAALKQVADVMIPEGDGYPAAGEFVVPFTEARVSPAELATIEPALERLGADPSPAAVSAALERLSSEDPDTFGQIMVFVYFGYYASPIVHRIMQQRGFDYHGAPQPLGYRLDKDPQPPAKPRGTYVPTEEVRRVTL